MDDRTRPRPSKDAVRSDVPHAPWASRVRTLESDARRQAVLDRRRRREMGTDEAAPLCEGGRLAKRLMRGDIPPFDDQPEATGHFRSEEHTSELQSLMRISYAVFCL